jgi:tRNA-specific 2-thiouridylase
MSAAPTVLVAMSGGVDSSVAAALLVERGYDVTGVTLKLWGGDSDSGCCSVSDVEDARRVASQLGIPHYVFDYTDSFSELVVGPYVREHAAGRTPNPCVDCNRQIKFGRLLERLDALGLDLLATGHHARTTPGADGRRRLRRGADAAKDQSYVLAMLTARELDRVCFPVGELTKPDVRRYASRLGMRTASKPDSQEVCFITRGGRRRFLRERLHDRGGPVVDADGDVVGSHDGYTRFTVGQRRGLGIASGTRRFVLDVDAPSATVTVGSAAELLRRAVRLRACTFVHQRPGGRVLVQTRAHGHPASGRLVGETVEFDDPQPRVAPGQLVALYSGEEVVGSGVAC